MAAPQSCGWLRSERRADFKSRIAYSILTDSQVNFCLVPEVPFSLARFLAELRERLERRGHAVIIVAEVAVQDLMAKTAERDASGNIKYGDIGTFLRDAIKDHLRRIGMEISIKYIDPSYMIRSVPANPHDSAFCLLLGQSAVHARMSGRTNMVISFWNHQLTHVPISVAVSQRKIQPARKSGIGVYRRCAEGRRYPEACLIRIIPGGAHA